MSEPAVARPSLVRRFFGTAGVWLPLTALLLVADQWTKRWATATLEYGRPEVVTPYFDLTLLHNTGAAFSLLADSGGWQRTFFIVLSSAISVLLFVWLLRLPSRGRTVLAMGLAMILSGAIGNLIDRVMLGYVVDFLHFHYEGHYWPAFNVADAAITGGAILVLLDSFRSERPPEKPAEDAGEDAAA